MPPDLEAALGASGPAREFFDKLGKTDRYLVTLPLLKARTPAIRAARLQKIINDLTARKKP